MPESHNKIILALLSAIIKLLILVDNNIKKIKGYIMYCK
jgi:hypothetical protein